MNEELLSILRSARRKLVGTRAMESAAIMMIFGASFYIVIQFASLLSHWHPQIGVFVAGILSFAILLVCLLLLARREYLGDGSDLSLVAWFFGCFLLCPAFAGIIPNYCQGLPRFAVPAVGELLAAGLGAFAILLWRPDLCRVAAMLDAKGRLRERLSTAAELALSDGPLPPSAPVVFEQALAALREKRPQRMPLWSASPALPAAMGLSLAMCLAISFLPGGAAARQGGQIDQFSHAMPALTQEQRQRLAEAFRQAAAQQAAAPAVSRELVKAAAVVEVQDARELQQVLQKLQEAGYTPLAAVPRDLLAAAGLPTPATMTAGNEGEPLGAGAAMNEPNEPPPGGGGYVSVYDPRYAAHARPGEEESDLAPAAPQAAVPYADAWAAARARAADHARSGQVPPAYRRLVRDFFAGP